MVIEGVAAGVELLGFVGDAENLIDGPVAIDVDGSPGEQGGSFEGFPAHAAAFPAVFHQVAADVFDDSRDAEIAHREVFGGLPPMRETSPTQAPLPGSTTEMDWPWPAWHRGLESRPAPLVAAHLSASHFTF